MAGAVVRCGIIFAIGLVFLADRKGRRRMLIVSAVLAPVLCVLGAVAPSLVWLTVTQTLGRPVGIALLLLVGIVAAEEMPRNSRAYAISVVAMAGGLGAGLCVVALPLADLGERGWRLVYVVPLAFLVDRVGPVAADARDPPVRGAAHHVAPPLQRRRFVAAGGVGAAHEPPGGAAVVLQQPLPEGRAQLQRRQDLAVHAVHEHARRGRHRGRREAGRHTRAPRWWAPSPWSAARSSPSSSSRWAAGRCGCRRRSAALIGGAAIPALGVYGAELFPTGNRGKASGLISMLALVGSSIGLLARRLGPRPGDRVRHGDGRPRRRAPGGGGAGGDLYPETAHHELEDLNPEDRMDGLGSPSEAAQPAGHG